MDSVRNKGYIFIQEVPNDGKSQQKAEGKLDFLQELTHTSSTTRGAVIADVKK